jgi:hypothetical protein
MTALAGVATMNAAGSAGLIFSGKTAAARAFGGSGGGTLAVFARTGKGGGKLLATRG